MYGNGHYYGAKLTDQETVQRLRARWFMRTSSGKRIWPGQHYIRVDIYYDHNGRPPIKGLSWVRIYTEKEYFLRKMQF